MRGDPEPVGAGYYHAMGIVLREGRELTETNRSESVLIAIVNEAFAKEFFPKGRRLGNESSRIGPTRRPRRSPLSACWATVVAQRCIWNAPKGCRSIGRYAETPPSAGLQYLFEQRETFEPMNPTSCALLQRSTAIFLYPLQGRSMSCLPR